MYGNIYQLVRKEYLPPCSSWSYKVQSRASRFVERFHISCLPRLPAIANQKHCSIKEWKKKSQSQLQKGKEKLPSLLDLLYSQEGSLVGAQKCNNNPS